MQPFILAKLLIKEVDNVFSWSSRDIFAGFRCRVKNSYRLEENIMRRPIHTFERAQHFGIIGIGP
jgi:hypothetical protein